jgi:hypothetical protein
MQITEALKLQMEVQKRLHEQLEVYFLVELIRQLYYISRLYCFLMLSTYEARTLLGLGVSDINTTLIITLNYVIFPNYYRCRCVRVSVRVHVVSDVRVGIRTS